MSFETLVLRTHLYPCNTPIFRSNYNFKGYLPLLYIGQLLIETICLSLPMNFQLQRIRLTDSREKHVT